MSEKESITCGGTAGVLDAERKRATFDVQKLTHVLDGGPEKTKRRYFIISPTKNVDVSDKPNWEREKHLAEHVKVFLGVHESYWNIIPTREEASWMSENSVVSGALMNHYGLFLPTLSSQCSDEQKYTWAIPAIQLQIIGSYGQTELGHGSNVRGLQTTAVYDVKTEEFILNTPTLRSLKWWPGALGKVGTHTIVYAQLIIDGKEYGVHSFIMQIRDENHQPLPGIELGDVGNKLGDHANDTGFMRLTNVRIPRDRMLAKNQQVTPEGKYVLSAAKMKNSKLHYATMMFTRGTMVKSSGGWLARAVTIATRYSCVRTQGFANTRSTSYKAEERPIIDYQVQRYRLLKQIALAYAIKFTGKWMLQSFSALEGTGNATYELKSLDSLPFLAATSAGLKALCTFLAWTGIEDCRKCCGGNGYLMSTGISQISADYVWQTTAEGDWIVLMLQTGRFLVKTMRNALKGEIVTGPVDYMEPLINLKTDPKTFNPEKYAPKKPNTVEELINLDYLLSVFKNKSLSAVLEVGALMNWQLGKDEEDATLSEALNKVSLELTDAVRIHCYTFLLHNFIEVVRTQGQDKDVTAVLEKVCALYAITIMADDSRWIGYLDAKTAGLVKGAVVKLLDDLRPNALALVDAFDFPDRVLCSTIGRSDGMVYEALFEQAKKSTLNKREVFDGYEEVLRPRLDLEFLKNGNNRFANKL